jgi:hypothetical protein
MNKNFINKTTNNISFPQIETTFRILLTQTIQNLPLMILYFDVSRQTYVQLISRDKLEEGGGAQIYIYQQMGKVNII